MTLLDSTIADAEKLFTSVRLLLDEAKKQQQFAEQTEQAGHILVQKKQAFDSEKEAFAKEKESFEGEKQFIAREGANIKVQEGINTRLKVKIDADMEVLKTREEEIGRQDKELTVKLKLFQNLEEREKQIQSQTALMDQEKAIDRQRKALLDAREKRLGEREDHINRMSQM